MGVIRARVCAVAALGILAVGCGDDGGGGGADPNSSEGQANALAEADCTDPAQNPYMGTCVEGFMADCWNPTGTCSGTAGLETELEWENGARVDISTHIDLSGVDFTMIDPENPMIGAAGANSTFTGEAGTICASSQTRSDKDDCYSQTVYTRNSDAAVMTFCVAADGSAVVTCPDGTTVEIAQDAPGCQNGAGTAGGCEIEVQDLSMISTDDLGGLGAGAP